MIITSADILPEAPTAVPVPVAAGWPGRGELPGPVPVNYKGREIILVILEMIVVKLLEIMLIIIILVINM
jgi:hypothetical protein